MNYKANMFRIARGFLRISQWAMSIAAWFNRQGNSGTTLCSNCGQETHRSNMDLHNLCIDCWE